MKTVTIITVVYNAQGTLASCIQSVLAQTYPHIEYLIIDGQSTDGTINVIKTYQPYIHQWISEKDRGMYDAMNKGLQLAHGEIIGFLNADDILASPDVIADIVQVFESQAVDSCYGDLVYTAPDNFQHILRYWHVPDFEPEMFANGLFPPHPTFYVKKEVYARHGGFNLCFRIAADVELMLRFLVKHRISIAYLPKLLVKMRSGGKANKNMRNILTGVFESYQGFKMNAIEVPRLFVPKTLWFRMKQRMKRNIIS